MKAYRMTAWKTTPEYQEIPQPDPGPGQVLVKVGAAGICHSDVHVIHEFDAGVFNAELPFTLGHENAGWVEALGPGATGFEVGEAVAALVLAAAAAWARIVAPHFRTRLCLRGLEELHEAFGWLPGTP